MENPELRERLIEEAQSKNICTPGFERLCHDSMEGLIDYYKEMPDWCLERGFPDYKTLKAILLLRADTGVFIHKTFHGELLNDSQVYILHNCRGTIKVGLNISKKIIPMLYLANGCRVRIVGTGDVKPTKKSGRSIVPIYTYGKNDVSARDNAFVKFIHHKNDLI